MLLVGGYNQDESELINAKMLASSFFYHWIVSDFIELLYAYLTINNPMSRQHSNRIFIQHND